MKGIKKKNINKYFLIMLLSILLISCNNFFYGATRNMRYVYDYNYWQDGIPSYQVNTGDRYCVFTFKMDKHVKSRIISFLTNKNIKFVSESDFNFTDGKISSISVMIDPIKRRETENDFENCDYLMVLGTYKNDDNKKSIYLDIDIYDIKTDKRIGTYTMHEDDTIFKKTTQEQKVEKMLNEWWKTQIKPQPKARPLEKYCVGNCDNNK